MSISDTFNEIRRAKEVNTEITISSTTNQEIKNKIDTVSNMLLDDLCAKLAEGKVDVSEYKSITGVISTIGGLYMREQTKVKSTNKALEFDGGGLDGLMNRLDAQISDPLPLSIITEVDTDE